MEERLSALFEESEGSERGEKEIESLQSNIARVESDNAKLYYLISQLKIDNARLIADLTNIFALFILFSSLHL